MNGYYLYPSKLKDCYQDELQRLRRAYSVKTSSQNVYYRNINGRNLGKSVAMAIWYDYNGRSVAMKDHAPKKIHVKPVKKRRGLTAILLVIILELVVIAYALGKASDSWTPTAFTGDIKNVNLSPVRFTEEELKAFYDKHSVKKAEAKVLGASTVNVEELIRKHFGKDADKAIKCFKSESGLRPTAINRANRNKTVDFGLSQINSVHCPKVGAKDLADCEKKLLDPETNLVVAKQIFESRGNTFAAWYGKGCR